ncbi:MAG: hypothetical protein EXX96DRAFT_570335 [Benjaminiella poitrasii]|nr:MAG: hypothetical protein EXX96DRAFT_570335 [Benjaminiella poitrasii]
MHQFYKEASTEFKRICMLSSKMEESYEQVVRFYGEDPKKMPPDEFFGIFREFTGNWEKCSADSKEFRMKQDRLEKQKKREQERRKRTNSNAGLLKSKNVDNEDDTAILHSLLDKLKKDTLDVKSRRRSDRQRSRQRSTSVSASLYSQPNMDSLYSRANKMLRNIQGENSSTLLLDGPHPTSTVDGFYHNKRRMSASVAMKSSFKPMFFEADLMSESPMAATATTSFLNVSSPIPEITKASIHTGSKRHGGGRPLSAIIIPKTSLSSQSLSSTINLITPTVTRHVRVRKTSTRPVFDHTLRVRARRMSTR